MSAWRKSATLILLARNVGNKIIFNHNYKVLMFTRTDKTSFMSGSACFPGGVIDEADESLQWLNHFNKFGITEKYLNDQFQGHGSRPPIFKNQKKDGIIREISLRISAIRETFEEVGILLCRKKSELESHNNDTFGKVVENFDRERWQKIVHSEPGKFLELCQKLNVVPDVWGLNEWSDWLTPASFGDRRFETAFFTTVLNCIPKVHGEANEVKEIYWSTPAEYFAMHINQEIWLPPPQFYELKKLSNFHSLDQLAVFAIKRLQKGMTLFLPVQYVCKDGMVSVLPGDDCYPDNPNDQFSPIPTKKTMEEFRQETKNLHRIEYGTLYNTTLHMNIDPPDGNIFFKSNSKL